MTVELQAITMPKWGLAMDEGMVVDWHVEEGARLTPGDEIVDIETTKITNALESPAGGILCRAASCAGAWWPRARPCRSAPCSA
jgi:pyruvate dehydrogenase E2 component (dihydrolipoamide acetyltransferase)